MFEIEALVPLDMFNSRIVPQQQELNQQLKKERN